MGSQFGETGLASACAQVPPRPTVPQLIPNVTIGPVDPACQRVPDTDDDSVFDYQDNCHRFFNPMQTDTDKDSGEPPYEPVPVTVRDPVTGGDACDTDDDNDAKLDIEDNCPKVVNADQKDADNDGLGDLCDPQDDRPNPAARPRPKLKLAKLPRRVQRAEINAGLSVGASCSAPCALRAELRHGKKLLGRRLGGLGAKGSTFLFVKLTKSANKQLAKRGRLSAKVVVVATDDIGRRDTASRRVTLTR